MRKVALLGAAVVVGWAGWRITRRIGVEKLGAVLTLGRERGLEVVQSVLGGRAGHAA